MRPPLLTQAQRTQVLGDKTLAEVTDEDPVIHLPLSLLRDIVAAAKQGGCQAEMVASTASRLLLDPIPATDDGAERVLLAVNGKVVCVSCGMVIVR